MSLARFSGRTIPCIFMFVIFSLLSNAQTEECTIGVASGASTRDGRPMIWKTRDYNSEPNNVIHFDISMNNKFIYVTGGGSTGPRMGVNEYGLSIANSTSSDLPDGSDTGYFNGDLIRAGLGLCATVEQFQNILDNTNISGRRTNGNFVIIDSTGAAALFEVGEKVYWRFDASADPNGYILRTNFSVHGGGTAGIERFKRTTKLISDFYSGDTLDYRSVLRYQMRDFSDESSDPFPIPYNGFDSGPYGYIRTDVSICRKTSVSAAVITGVLPGEDTRLSTMWTILGQPAASVALPYWPVDQIPPEADGLYAARLCDVALQIKGRLFDYSTDSYYIDTHKLLDGNGSGLWTRTFPYEDKVLGRVDSLLTVWRGAKSVQYDDMKFIEDSLAKDALGFLQGCYSYLVSDPKVEYPLGSGPMVYPNPFDRETILSFDLTDQADVKIDIYTLTGILVHSEVLRNQPPGRWKKALSLDQSSKGNMFILRIRINNVSKTLKLVKGRALSN